MARSVLTLKRSLTSLVIAVCWSLPHERACLLLPTGLTWKVTSGGRQMASSSRALLHVVVEMMAKLKTQMLVWNCRLHVPSSTAQLRLEGQRGRQALVNRVSRG